MDAKTEKKERSHEKILESARSMVREKGLFGTSIADVMEGAGMTVGGFYAHFPSKQSLVAEALKETLRQSCERLEAYAGDEQGADRIKAIAGSYLSRAHRDMPKIGCPLPATLGDIARADDVVRQVFASEIDDQMSLIEQHLQEADRDEPRGEALAILATMVGGLTIARALKGTELSDEVLKACRSHIDECLTD